jgi:hypothetical protein
MVQVRRRMVNKGVLYYCTSTFSLPFMSQLWQCGTNDVREREDMNRIEGGDLYLAPVNMTPAEKPAAERPP